MIGQPGREVDPQDAELSVQNADPNTTAGIEIEPIPPRAAGGVHDFGSIEEDTRGQRERSGAKDGMVAGEAAVQMLGHLDRAGEIVGAVLVTVAVLGFVRWQRVRRERKAARRTKR